MEDIHHLPKSLVLKFIKNYPQKKCDWPKNIYVVPNQDEIVSCLMAAKCDLKRGRMKTQHEKNRQIYVVVVV